jgi:uncharacterized protein (DUF1778 family)
LKKTAPVSVRFSKEEREVLEAAVAKRKCSISDLVREIVGEYAAEVMSGSVVADGMVGGYRVTLRMPLSKKKS